MNTAIKPSWSQGNLSLAQAYQPIIRGYFIVAAIYYAVVTPAHIWTLSGGDLLAQVGVSVTACIAAACAAYHVRQPRNVRRLENITSAINLILIINVLVAMEIQYSQAKILYFIMLTMIFALAGVTMRQALVSISAALGGLYLELLRNEPGQLEVYAFVSLAAAISAIAIAHFLQRAIGVAVATSQQAERDLHSAAQRLETAERLGEKMRRQSLSDSLTGLPNRRAFFEALKTAKNKARQGHASWLVLLDLDGFKSVNDNYGHILGDELLRSVATRLCDTCGDDAHVSRMGGDEFNIILSGSDEKAHIEAWCEQLLAILSEVYQIEDRLILISGSVGCYRIQPGEHDAKLMQKADYALLHAKRNGKNRFVLFREEHARDAAERFAIEQALRVADFGAEIELVFQPQIDMASERLLCAEALARWSSPNVDDIGPDRFIRIAEESGLVAKITLAVLDKALATITAWEKPVPVSINLSGHDLLSDQIVQQIIARVQASGIDPRLVEFEVTETAMMSDTRRASANLLRLSALGHPIALDDFGTGYSNFSYLRTLPITKLKVDRSFMENIADPMTEKILKSLTGMARTLDVHCLLEGIENELELVVARRVGAQSVQGFLFGMPMSASALYAIAHPPADPAKIGMAR